MCIYRSSWLLIVHRNELAHRHLYFVSMGPLDASTLETGFHAPEHCVDTMDTPCTRKPCVRYRTGCERIFPWSPVQLRRKKHNLRVCRSSVGVLGERNPAGGSLQQRATTSALLCSVYGRHLRRDELSLSNARIRVHSLELLDLVVRPERHSASPCVSHHNKAVRRATFASLRCCLSALM